MRLKILVTTELLKVWASRDAEGNLVTIEIGKPDADGFYSPTFTRHADDNLVERYRAVVESARDLDALIDFRVVRAHIAGPMFLPTPEFEKAAGQLREALIALDVK